VCRFVLPLLIVASFLTDICVPSMGISPLGLTSTALATPPELPDGTETATRRLAGFKVPDGMKVELFAAEPKLASPVAIGLDERNRVFVAEEYRFNLGTEENRTRPFLLEDDLQIQTLDDRLKMYEKFASRFEGGMDWFRKVSDQVRLVEDLDGDGRADRSTVFAPGFNGVLDGLAAGVMATDGDVYFTCIPNLWRLRDTNGDGVADERTVIQTGFGVNAGFLGHDLHGLCWGPDGKLYFSVGDRGFHLTTQGGARLHGPRNGAVFSCFPDGSDFQVVCRGLRNPQELAFDQFGNLFAADNNCDKGDHSRLVYCLPGSDSGWNMAFQSIPDPYLTGPWHAEKMWHLWNGSVDPAVPQSSPNENLTLDRPAWVLPPVGKIGAGPSGFTYYPGTGLSPRYDHHFFLCNYTGNGGIESFSIRPRGAGFEVIDEHDFLKPISATDCEFGYDGKLYVSDFVNLIWNGGSSGGRIYTVFDQKHVQDPAVKQTGELVRGGFKKLNPEALTELLGHADQRIRLRAQFELASRGADSVRYLQATLATSRQPLARLHAVWGLGQLAAARTVAGEITPATRSAAATALMTSVQDDDEQIRAWTVRLLGTHRHEAAIPVIQRLLSDKSPRVQLFAALAMSQFPESASEPELRQLIQSNSDADPWIRHACVMIAAQSAPQWFPPRVPKIDLLGMANDKNPSVRLVALLALRHAYKSKTEWTFHPNRQSNGAAPSFVSTARGDSVEPVVRDLLRDEQIYLVAEAARAINDLPLDEATPALAALAPTLKGAFASTAPESLARRIINANFRLGEVEHAQRVLAIVVESGLSLPIRREALAALLDWDQPGPRDRVTGFWRPIRGKTAFAGAGPARDVEEMGRVKLFLAENITTLLGQASNELQPDVVKLIAHYQLPTDDKIFAGWIADSTKSIPTRTAALRLLATRQSPLALSSIELALGSDRPPLRAEARDMLALLKPAEAIGPLEQTLNSEAATIIERQRALATLASIKLDTADAILRTWLMRLNVGQVSQSLELDVLDAATARNLPEFTQAADTFRAQRASGDLLSRFQVALQGGDRDRGRDLFVGHRVGQCIRCHSIGVGLVGGKAGPDLHQVATRHDRTSLLQSLIDPNAKIAKGFETVTLVMQDGKIYGGLIRKEEEGLILLEKSEGGTVTLKVSDVEERSAAKSAMPEMNRALTPRELRDLVEFLSTLK
jgi:quinoprotein glucose dehydrogenase